MARYILAALALLTGLAGALPADAQRANGKGSNRTAIIGSANTVGSPAWCKGNGNQNAAQCPIFAPGSTAPNSYNANQPAPTANQLPQSLQVPTMPSVPMKWVAPGESNQGATAAPTGNAPPPPPPALPAGSVPVAQASVPAVGTVITDKPPLTAAQEIASYGSFDADGNFVINPDVSPDKNTNFVQVQPGGNQASMNVGQLQMFIGMGFVNRDGSRGAGSPFRVTHVPPPSTAAQFQPGTRVVPIDHVIASGSTQNILPGGAGVPLAAAELGRIGVAGGGAPVDPKGLTSFYNSMVVDGKDVYVQMTQAQVATAMQSGLLKPDGSGIPQGYQGTWGNQPAVVFLPVPPARQLTPQAPGTPQAPPLAPNNVPTLKPGFAAYPHYVGPRDPDSGYPVPPSPPQQLTPPAPGAPQAPPQQVMPNPPQTFTGYAPYMVPSQQQLTPPAPGGPQAPPQNVPPNPPQTITGYAPYMVPPQMQVEVPRPRPRPLPPQGNPPPTGQATVTVTPQGGGTHVGADFVTAKSGRQAPTAVPVFEAKGTGDRWHCVASGHHVRKVFDDNGNEVYAGALPGVAIQVVPVIRDVPAWHDLSSECIISVGEHPKAKAARR